MESICQRPVRQLRLWEWERDTAINTLKRQMRKRLEDMVDPIVLRESEIERLSMNHMETPRDMIQLVKDNPGVEKNLRERYPFWEDTLSFLAQKQKELNRHKIQYYVSQGETALSILLQKHTSWENLARYCNEDIRKLILEIEELGVELRGDLKEIVAWFKKILEKPIFPEEPGVRREMGLALLQKGEKLQEAIRSLRLKGTQEGTLYLGKLVAIDERIGAYGVALYSPDISKVTRSFLMAQVRYGTLENKKIAFHQLQRLFCETQEVYFPKDVLREILSSPDHEFRAWVIWTLRQTEGLFSKEAGVWVDYYLARCSMLSPEERMFQEHIETMINLLSHPEDMIMGKANCLMNGAPVVSSLEQIGVIRASAKINPSETAKSLLEAYPKITDEEVLKVVTEELMAIAKREPEVMRRLIGLNPKVKILLKE